MVVEAVFEERYWYPDDGGQVWLAGYTPTHEGRYLGRDAPELARAASGSPASPERQHTTPKRSNGRRSARRSTLKRDAANEHDPNAIQVLAGEEQIGWVPREIAAELAPQIDAGTTWSAVSFCASSATRCVIRAPA